MDAETIRIYDAKAALFARDWEDIQPPPFDMHRAVAAYFREGPTIDVGCGSGRDTAWLVDQGFDAFGIDASLGLIAEAQRRHPSVRFEANTLPELQGLKEGSFTNILCETVIMHLLNRDAMEAVSRLVTLLAPGGTLYLSWRATNGIDRRDDVGRLYASFDVGSVREILRDLTTLVDERIISDSSSNELHRIIARHEENWE